ncbi:MAG: acetyl/propionyl/methylcrotonyl-CoA carboxylase subunit alpha [Betaproteobacteria bacterium]|nr:acetyl/propionyl/methylcrotonyl-CoA carboxylase subunit alpha [Betaproteobacteria bacterium]
MFNKILIANRGEIACRVIRTAKHLGIRTVAVYSEADAGARHVALADEAHLLGPAAARESYLRGDRLIEIAVKSGAEAIHPGYGFLSENAGFAEACAQAGVAFIGPPAAAIRAMGSKSAAKEIMAAAKVPLVPGYHGRDQDLAILSRAAGEIGYPVLIKASAGGGGKGMRIVHKAPDFKDALASAKREAASSFGDDQVLVEKYLTRPRHIEIQVFADSRGDAVYLFERDCSVQRRHQKVLEEAPAPGMTPERRKQMGAAAAAAAKAIGYVGAGTVEFIADQDGTFYFMEMNTRLQVEHPVTEMITGVDLVEWQLRVAAGEPLPLAQDELAINGHAIEARIYAEDPAKDFLPAIGRITHLRLPAEGAHVRIDTGVRQGDEISMYYDPMIAKLIVWDRDRAAALRRLRGALGEFQVAGLATNIQFLSAVTAHRAFAGADLDTGLIERHRAELFPEAAPASDTVLAIAVLSELMCIDRNAERAAAASGDPHSPWHSRDGWRLNEDNHHTFLFKDGAREVAVTAHYRKGGYLLDLPGAPLEVRGETDESGDLLADLAGTRLRASVVRSGDELTILGHGLCHKLTPYNPVALAMDQDAPSGSLAAPMPGTVIEVMVKEKDAVEKGAPLMILEAMKMEHTIVAPLAGRIAGLYFRKGDQVSEGVELLKIEGDEKQ